MKSNLKICSRCEKEKVIWKNFSGHRYCLPCWNIVKPDNPFKSPPKPKKSISKVSEKRILSNKMYLKLRKEFLKEHSCCVAKLAGCTHCIPEGLTIQHTRGRVGSLYLDTRYWITLCLNCHRWVNENPEQAIGLGLAKLRLTKEED